MYNDDGTLTRFLYLYIQFSSEYVENYTYQLVFTNTSFKAQGRGVSAYNNFI